MPVLYNIYINMSVEQKCVSLTPNHKKLIQKIKEERSVASDSEVIRRGIERYAKEFDISIEGINR